MAAMNPMMAMFAQMAQLAQAGGVGAMGGGMGATAGMGALPQMGAAAASPLQGGTEKLRKFIEVNRLDASASQRLMSLSNLEADWVMDKGFVIGSDPSRGTDSAVAMGRIKKVKSAEVQQELLYYPHSAAISNRLDEFIQINGLDDDCANVLRQLSQDMVQRVMGDDFLLNVNTSLGTCSAVVMGRVKRAREEHRSGGGPPSKMARMGYGRW